MKDSKSRSSTSIEQICMPETPNLNTNRRITFAYLIALAMIAMVLIISHTLLYRQLSKNSTDGNTINIAGMQRMLSQRIALMSGELVKSSDRETALLIFKKLSAATEKMATNQAQLKLVNAKRLSEEMQKLVEGENGTYQEVTTYLALANSLQNQYEQNPDDKLIQKETAQKIANIARNGFLDRLNKIVFQYEHEYESRSDFFSKMELGFLILGLSVLLLEAFFIFRPMANTITHTVAKLESANNELQEFAYRISHDLRAPVASSIGLNELAMEAIKENDRDTAINCTERIGKAMVRLDALIGDVISVTRSRHENVEPEQIELPTMVDEILQAQRGLPGFERLQITTELEQYHPLIAKRLFLKQSLENLISNAIKYADNDEKNPELIIRSTCEGHDLKIEISDNGLGIPADSQKDVFGMFKRFHPKHAVGSGLGLYLVKQNVKALDGTIEYLARPKGTSFVIRVPSLPKGT